jgi:hypothetical protein
VDALFIQAALELKLTFCCVHVLLGQQELNPNAAIIAAAVMAIIFFIYLVVIYITPLYTNRCRFLFQRYLILLLYRDILSISSQIVIIIATLSLRI